MSFYRPMEDLSPNPINSRTNNSLCISSLGRTLLKMSDCKRFCNNFLFIWLSLCVCVSLSSLWKKVCITLLKSGGICGLYEPKAKLLPWEKHHLNLLILFICIIQALKKIITVINIIIDAFSQEICFGKPQTVVIYFLWAGIYGITKEKLIWNSLCFCPGLR